MTAAPRRRRSSGHEEEEHVNHERWLLTYADMITLLMVLFIVLFAMSTVDQKKFNALKEGLAAGFGQSTSVLDGSSSILEEPGMSVAEPINPNAVAEAHEIQQIAASAAEDEQVSGVGIALERFLDDHPQAGKALAHVGVAGRQPDPRAGGDRDHRPNNAAITPCRSTTSAPASARSR